MKQRVRIQIKGLTYPLDAIKWNKFNGSENWIYMTKVKSPQCLFNLAVASHDGSTERRLLLHSDPRQWHANCFDFLKYTYVFKTINIGGKLKILIKIAFKKDALDTLGLFFSFSEG